MALSQETTDLLGGNVVNTRVLRSCTGRATHIAALLCGWLPCVAMLWSPRGACMAYFAGRFTNCCVTLLDVEHGSASSPVTVVGLRLWCWSWVDKRITHFDRSDGVSALTLLVFSKASGPLVALMQEFIQQIPTQAATPREKLVEVTEETDERKNEEKR